MGKGSFIRFGVHIILILSSAVSSVTSGAELGVLTLGLATGMPVTVEGGAQCTRFDTLRIDGAAHLEPAARDSIRAQVLGHCLTNSEVEAAVGQITRWYLSRGFITTHAYRQIEPFASPGELRVLVVEGTIQGYRVEHPGWQGIHPTQIFPFSVGHVLNLRAIEQGVEQLNRLPSFSVSADIEPGDALGQSVVKLMNHARAPWQLGLALDNYGNASSGRLETSASATIDNALGLADQVSVTASHTLPFRQRAAHAGNYSASYSMPLGPTLMTLGWRSGEYGQIIGLSSGLGVLGTGSYASRYAQLAYTMWRDQTLKLEAHAKLDIARYENDFDAQVLPLQSPRLTMLEFGTTARRTLSGGAMTSDLGLVQGTRWFGATADLPYPGLPLARFVVLQGGVSVDDVVTVGRTDLSIHSVSRMQWSRQRLYSGAQMLIGGPQTVRPYLRYGLSGSSGGYTTNSVGLPGVLGMQGIATLEPYVGIDAGKI
ncbi:hypothetical protein LGM43_36815, partial [Burkholderia seminalis]|uniref:ShlB/FhaC/HecB family hemolysin secretion/activation protein n=1 Tax=Burkholderia seminalis TaxID=488731 RepID=UPI001CF55230